MAGSPARRKGGPIVLQFFLLLSSLRVFSEELKTAAITEPGENLIEPRYGTALTEAYGSNLILLAVNRFIRQADYSFISLESIQRNIQSAWVWDQDEFSVNQIGHPYQGSFYYIAGRSNGLGFLGSTALTLSGSIAWELLFETETPSINDLIVTTLGAVSVGEILHRLYVEADHAGWPVKWLLSPFDGINDAIFGPPARNSAYSEIFTEETSLSAGAGFLRARMDAQRGDAANLSMPSFFGDALLVYGDPYAQRTRRPYQQFELQAKLVVSVPYYSIEFISDGSLLSFFLWESPRRNSAVGLNLHYDFIFGSLVNFSSNALGLSYKTRRLYSNHWTSSMKFHLNWVALGTTESVRIRYGDISYKDIYAEHRDYDLKTGWGTKLFLTFSHPRGGTIKLGHMLSAMRTITGAVPENGSEGYSLLGTADLAYERKIGTFQWGVRLSAYFKKGFYRDIPNVNEVMTNCSLYINKSFNNPA